MRISNNLRQRLHNILKLLFLHTLFFILGTALFISFFRTNLFRDINIFFYRGIVLLSISCILMVLFQCFYQQKAGKTLFTNRDIILSLVLIFCLNLVFFTHLPVTADRSVSVFMLGYLDSNPEKIMTNKEMAQLFSDKYLSEYGEIGRRFNEQIASGNVIQTKNGYQITKQGRFLMKVYRLVADIFAIDQKLVSPTYLHELNQ